MPRTYKRRTDYGLISHDSTMEAVQLVMGGMSVRKVAHEKGLSKSSLSRYVQKHKENPTAVLAPNYSHSQIFTTEREKQLEDYLVTCSQMFHGLTLKHVRCLAYEMAHTNGLTMPPNWVKDQQAGADWLTGFLKRHPNLSIRSPEATSLARATAFNEHNIKAYFDILESLITKLNVGGRAIYNLDETGCTTVQRVPKVISKKGLKQVGQVTSRERGELVTLCGVISATGVALPPVCVFPRKNYRSVFMNGAPEGSLGFVNASGWMTSSNFVKVLDHI
jgi:predicted transcriptional regulator